MKNFTDKIFTKYTLIILIVGLGFFGVIKYSEYRLKIISNQVEQSNTKLSLADQKIQQLEAMLLGTQSSITNVLGQEQQKNKDLKDQFTEITNTVGALEKLSTIDPELLKKYSKVYFLNEHYVPVSLADINQKYRSKTSTSFQFYSDALPYLEDLLNAADDDNLLLRAQSAYRSFATQSVLKDGYKITYGIGTANKFSADQGYSEHQLGTTLDFTTVQTNGALEGFDKTPEYQWLLNNAYKYGFIISYPANNKYYKFEPWHWRFVGVALATKLHDDGLYFYNVDQRLIDTYLVHIFE